MVAWTRALTPEPPIGAGRRGRGRAALVLALSAAALLAAGCEGDAVAEDGGVDPPQEDAAPADDARIIADGGCAYEFKACGGDAGGCGDPAFDCIAAGIDPSKTAWCLRRCRETAECPYNSYCVPDSTRIDFGGLINAARHCFISPCGQIYGNGAPFGTCWIGGDNFVRLDRAEQRPGTCIPADSDAGTGVCTESGSTADGGVPAAGRDQACTADPVASGCLPRERIIGCQPGMACAAPAGATDGVCRLLCDPMKAEPSDPSTCTTSPQSERQWCQDSSAITIGVSGGVHLGYVGICQPDFPGCDLFSAADCAAGQGCLPTTMVNPHGLCLPVGQATGECAGDLDCAPGSLCTSEGAEDPLRCRALCDLGGGGHGCAGGQSCEAVALDPQQPGTLSLTWGVCAEAATPDGGTPDAS